MRVGGSLISPELIINSVFGENTGPTFLISKLKTFGIRVVICPLKSVEMVKSGDLDIVKSTLRGVILYEPAGFGIVLFLPLITKAM